jgi:hypothetical protein
MEVDYEEVESLIHYQIRNMIGNGVLYDQEQALSDANLAFVKAHLNFDNHIASFNTHIGFRVWVALKNALRQNYKKMKPLSFSELDSDGQQQIENKLSNRNKQFTEEEHHSNNWMEDISSDAKEVLNLVLHPPKDVMFLLFEQGREYISTHRKCLKEYLVDCGWDRDRIEEAFEEIKEAMS